MVHLTREQQDEVARSTEPVNVLDPSTGKKYVLIGVDAYARLRHIFDDGPLSDDERRNLLLEAGKRAGWDDPEMDIYNDLDPRRSP